MEFEWDPNKNKLNQKKHGLSFEDAKELFLSGTDVLEIYDEEHSADEDRFIAIGPMQNGIVVVIYTEPAEGVVRILSARNATKREASLFRERRGATDE